METVREFIDILKEKNELEPDQWRQVLSQYTEEDREYAAGLARKVADEIYGKNIYVRGLIEFTNYCKNDCYYCGIRKSNTKASRYRLTREEILSCAQQGYKLGFRTFVLQGGEDAFYTDEKLCQLISGIKQRYPDCAITLSVGEREKSSYQRLYEAGADRYLLRHETALEAHYKRLHPENMSLKQRKQCLYDLKEIGYQVGCGIMVGSPYQTIDSLVEDMMFMQEFRPHMIGIGPFLPQKDTPFGEEEKGSFALTLFLLSLLRLAHPKVLLPATTALGTIHPRGREYGILAGANVVMPNLSPVKVRDKYALYDNKICTGEEAAECRGCLEQRIQSVGYQIVTARGDYKA